MSEPSAAAQASAAEPAPSAPTQDAQGSGGDASPSPEPPQRLSPTERRAQLIARLREGRERAAAERAASAGADAPSSEAQAGEDSSGAVTDHEDKDRSEGDGKKKTERPSEDRELELRAARLARELKDARADSVEYKPKAERYDAMVKKLEAAKGDAYQAVSLLPELLGMDFGQLAEFVVKNAGKFEESKRYAELPADLREELQLARQEREERTRREREASERDKQQKRFESYHQSVKSFLSEHADDYPLAAALEWAAGDVAQSALQRGTRDALPILKQLEENLGRELRRALSSDQVIRALVKSDKDLRTKIQAALGGLSESNKSPAPASMNGGASKPVTREGPATLTNGSTASDTASPLQRLDKAERKRQIAEAFRAQFGRSG